MAGQSVPTQSPTLIPAPDASVVCPACGGHNSADAVFCANTQCHKALGGFDYVIEELQAEARWHEKLADRFTSFVAKPQFVGVHVIWFTVWILLNSGLIVWVRRFDSPPYALLAFIISLESIMITIFVLISQSRQNRHADKRAELDYDVSVRTYREIAKLDGLLTELNTRLSRLEQRELENGGSKAG